MHTNTRIEHPTAENIQRFRAANAAVGRHRWDGSTTDGRGWLADTGMRTGVIQVPPEVRQRYSTATPPPARPARASIPVPVGRPLLPSEVQRAHELIRPPEPVAVVDVPLLTRILHGLRRMGVNR